MADLYKCDACGELTRLSWYRIDENETICEDCYLEWLMQTTERGL